VGLNYYEPHFLAKLIFFKKQTSVGSGWPSQN